LANTHASSQGAKHIRPQTDGKQFSSFILEYAPAISPSLNALINLGISTRAGQASTHLGSVHCGHLLDSSIAIFLEYPRETSLKFPILFVADWVMTFDLSICLLPHVIFS